MYYIRFLLYISPANAFAFPDVFHWQRRQSTCQNSVVYTIIEYPCAIQTFIPSSTVLLIDACNTFVNITNGPTYIDTIFTSTTTLGVTSTSTFTSTTTVTSTMPAISISTNKSTLPPMRGLSSVANEITPTIQSSPTTIFTSDSILSTPEGINLTPALPHKITRVSISISASSTATPIVPPSPMNSSSSDLPSSTEIIAPTLTSTVPSDSSALTIKIVLTSVSTAPPLASSFFTIISAQESTIISSTFSSPTPNCLPSISDYPGLTNVPSNTTWLIELYYIVAGNPVSTGAYLTRDGSATYSAAQAIQVFFANGVLFALDQTFGIGWYATSSPPVDAVFALQLYTPASGLTAKTFSMGAAWPYPLTWENCGFTESPATFLWDEDTGTIYVVFDGNENQGTNHEPMVLGLVAPPG